MESPSPDRPAPHLAFELPAPLVARFFLLLQQGVAIRRRVGCRVEAFLREEIGATQATIERIQSIVLDGRPVDDIGAAVVTDGSTLALSAALPGLVGATLRRGGAYASLRSGITYHAQASAAAAGTGWVTVKLFNLVMAELGPALLRDGVLVKTPELLDLLGALSPDVWRDAVVTCDGRAVDRALLLNAGWPGRNDRVRLSVASGSAGR